MLSRAQIVSIHQHSCGKARNRSLLQTGIQRPGLHRRACALILALAGHCSTRASADWNHQPLAELCSVPVGSVQPALPQGRRPPSGQGFDRSRTDMERNVLTWRGPRGRLHGKGVSHICRGPEFNSKCRQLTTTGSSSSRGSDASGLCSSYLPHQGMHTHAHTCEHTKVYTHMHKYMHVYVHCTHIHTCEHTKVHTCIHMYIHAYTHCTHAYSYTHVYTPTPLKFVCKKPL